MKKLALAFAFAAALAGSARAEVRATPQDAEDLVKTAASYLKKHGQEKAFQEFQNKNGPFIFKDLYVGVYDVHGKCLAHGADPSKAGKELPAQPEKDQTIIKARLAAMQGKDAAWQEYVYKNPATGKEEQKAVYTARVGEILISAGAYKTK